MFGWCWNVLAISLKTAHGLYTYICAYVYICLCIYIYVQMYAHTRKIYIHCRLQTIILSTAKRLQIYKSKIWLWLCEIKFQWVANNYYIANSFKGIREIWSLASYDKCYLCCLTRLNAIQKWDVCVLAVASLRTSSGTASTLSRS